MILLIASAQSNLLRGTVVYCFLSWSHEHSVMELEALIKHLRGELLHRETVILENIENLKVVEQNNISEI